MQADQRTSEDHRLQAVLTEMLAPGSCIGEFRRTCQSAHLGLSSGPGGPICLRVPSHRALFYSYDSLVASVREKSTPS
jgi:hypothetical protein